MRIVVTGGAGFIGAALVRRLLAEGHRVVVLDNFWRGSTANLEAVKSHPNITVIEGDVVNPADVQRCHDALGGVDLVHHLAAINGTKWFHEAAMDVIDVNVNGTLVALRHALEWGARFVLASSPEAYGENERMPLRGEDVSRFPSAADHQRFSYGASKYLDEVALHHAVSKGLDGRIVRPFNAYGVDMLGDAYGQVVGMFFQAVREQQPMAVHGDGSQTRSFTHIDDIVDGFYRAGQMDVALDGSPSVAAVSTLVLQKKSAFVRWRKPSIRRWVPWRWISSWAAGITAIQNAVCPIPMQQNACWDGPVRSRFRTGWSKFGRRFKPARSA